MLICFIHTYVLARALKRVASLRPALWIHVFIYIYIYLCTECVHLEIYIYKYTHSCFYIYSCLYLNIIYIYIHIYLYFHVYIYIYNHCYWIGCHAKHSFFESAGTGDSYSSDRWDEHQVSRPLQVVWMPVEATRWGSSCETSKKPRRFELKKAWVATSEPFNMHLAACFRSLLLDLCGPLLLASNVQCMVNQHASQQDRGVHFQRTAMASLTWAAMVLVSTKTPLQASLSLVLSHWDWDLVPKWGKKLMKFGHWHAERGRKWIQNDTHD